MSIERTLVGERVKNPSGSQVRRIVGKAHTAAGWRMKPDYLYTVVRAISARVNQNYDGWPSDELKKAAHTFVGKPVFVNHENFNPDHARGVVVASRYVENGRDKYIEVVQEIDAKRFPFLAHEIKTGGLDSVSMGAEAGFTICSACGNKAFDEPDMCDHVKHHKGETIRTRNSRTGKVEEKLVYESCHKLSFFELSYVFDPADETAVASKVIMGGRKHIHSSDCAPGEDCNGWNQSIENPTGDVGLQNSGGAAADAASATSTTDGGVGGSANADLGKTPATGGGSMTPGADGVLDVSRPLYDKVKTYNPDIGTYRVDSYHEHDHGALDVMTSNPAIADRVKSDAFAAGSPYVLWQQKQWNADGTSSAMEDRGSPTQNHMDHVHTAPPKAAPAKKAAMRRAILAKLASDDFAYPPNENSQKTQVGNTIGTYNKAHAYFDQAGAPDGKTLDYGAGRGHSAQFGDTFEPHPRPGFTPTHQRTEDIPDGDYHRVTNLNVLNVVPKHIRDGIVSEIGRTMAPGGHAIITTRGRDVMDAKGTPGPEPMSMVVGQGDQARYQKGFTPKELHEYVQGTLGPEYTVKRVPLGPAGVHITRNPGTGHGLQASLKERIAMSIYQKVAFGETEAPPEVDTLREEGTAPEDDNDDFHHFVESPPELSMPDTSQAAQIDREREEDAANGGIDTGEPGPASPNAEQPDGVVTDPDAHMMTLQIPMPQAQPAAPAGPPASAMSMAPPGGMAPAPAAPIVPPAPGQPPAPGAPPAAPGQQVPMQTFGAKTASQETLSWMERYYGYRVADWRDAITAGRNMLPEEMADYVREARLLTLENQAADSPTGRNPVKGTANMARSTLANRRKTAGTSHFAEGPHADGGDVSRNDQGEQEEVFITETPAPVSDRLPDDDTDNISNTEDNLVADEAYAKSLTSKLQQQKRELEATAREYQRVAGRRRVAEGEHAGGPVATEVDPELPTPSANELRGDDFDSADPGHSVDTSPAGPGTTTLPHESSLQAFRAFDKWLTAGTGRDSRQHSEANIKKAATQFANYNGISTQALFPALGIALRQARKTEAAKKGAKMRKRAVDLETAAPDERISVPAPVADTIDADAQASQFDEKGYANNAGDGISEYDDSTGQNFAPGQAPKTSRKADGILAIRCAEAMIAAGLEPNTREAKYQLATEYEKMSRGLILDRTALAERFAMVRHADRQKVASGGNRGAVSSPIPAGLGQGGSTRQASTQRQAANINHPDNDGLMFG